MLASACFLPSPRQIIVLPAVLVPVFAVIHFALVLVIGTVSTTTPVIVNPAFTSLLRTVVFMSNKSNGTEPLAQACIIANLLITLPRFSVLNDIPENNNATHQKRGCGLFQTHGVSVSGVQRSNLLDFMNTALSIMIALVSSTNHTFIFHVKGFLFYLFLPYSNSHANPILSLFYVG